MPIRRLVRVIVGLSSIMAWAGDLKAGESSPCGDEAGRRFLEVPSIHRGVAEELLGKEPWRALSTAELRSVGSLQTQEWKTAVLAKAARGSSNDRISAGVCSGTLIVRNRDLCPDAASAPLYLLVEVDPLPKLYVFAWKSVGKGSCQ